MKVFEFKNVEDLNKYFDTLNDSFIYDVVPVSRMFDNPKTGLLTNTITYVVILWSWKE